MKRPGFTLTETLVVVLILAILAGLSLPRLVKAVEKAKVNEALVNLDFIRTAQRRYLLSNNTYASSIAVLNIEDPNNTASRYFDYTIENADADNFTARAQRRGNAPENYSQYYYEIQKDGNVTSNGSPFI